MGFYLMATNKHKCVSHAHDRALIAFGSCVLETMHRHADWSPDTVAEIADAAHNLGLAHASPADLAGNFNVTPRSKFNNPLEL